MAYFTTLLVVQREFQEVGGGARKIGYVPIILWMSLVLSPQRRKGRLRFDHQTLKNLIGEVHMPCRRSGVKDYCTIALGCGTISE
jgi:hypothetical protein